MVVRGGTAILPVPGKPSCFSYYDIGRLLWASIFGMGFLERWAIRITWAEQRAGRKQTRSRVFFFLPFFIRWAVYSLSAGHGRREQHSSYIA